MDSASDSESSGSGEWLDVDQEANEGAPTVISLLDDRVFPDATSMLQYCREKHQFDFLAIRDRLGLDFASIYLSLFPISKSIPTLTGYQLVWGCPAYQF